MQHFCHTLRILVMIYVSVFSCRHADILSESKKVFPPTRPQKFSIPVMVSNIQIDSVLKDLTNYSGCFSLEEIDLVKPSPFKHISSYVLNTFESQITRGGHWLVITFFNDTSVVELFDSLGIPSLIPLRIRNALSQFGKVLHTTKSLQDPFSDCCGLYCIGRNISINRGQSLTKFLDNFGPDNRKNDILISRVVAQYTNDLCNVSESKTQ